MLLEERSDSLIYTGQFFKTIENALLLPHRYTAHLYDPIVFMTEVLIVSAYQRTNHV